MRDIFSHEVAHIISPGNVPTIDVLGVTIQFLTPPDKENAPCIMQGTVPASGVVPLHSHPDPETFLVISGGIEGLAYSPDRFTWIQIEPGDIFHVPGGAKHAFRNRRQAPAVMILVSTAKIGRFFQEIGTPLIPGASPGPPSEKAIQHFMETADRYGYWNATPEENAQVGL